MDINHISDVLYIYILYIYTHKPETKQRCQNLIVTYSIEFLKA